MDFFSGLFFDGLVPVFGSLISFLPQVVILLTLVSFFENSGFMLGFGCTTLAVAALENDDDKKTRRMIRFLSFIPCGAKMPVLLFICTVILGWNALFVIWLYAFAVLLGFALGGFRIVRPPKLIRATFKKRAMTVIKNTFDYVKRTYVAVFFATIVLFSLKYFSLFQPICGFLEPLFIPIGLGNAEIIAAILSGLVAKEMIIGALLVSKPIFTLASASSFLFFALLYTSCIPCLNAIRAKTNTRFAIKSALFNFAVAYFVAFMVYTVLIIM